MLSLAKVISTIAEIERTDHIRVPRPLFTHLDRGRVFMHPNNASCWFAQHGWGVASRVFGPYQSKEAALDVLDQCIEHTRRELRGTLLRSRHPHLIELGNAPWTQPLIANRQSRGI